MTCKLGLSALFVATIAFGVNNVASRADGSAPTGTQATKKTKKTEAPSKTPARVVMVYPPDTKGGVSAEISDVILDVATNRLTASGTYRAIRFQPSLPTIRRALNENSISQSDVSKATDSDARLKKLTNIAGYDMALVISVDDYEYDPSTNQVSLVMSARLLDFAGGKPRGAGQSGASPKNAAGVKEYDVAAGVGRDLTDKLLTSVLAPPKPAASDDSTKTDTK